MITLGSMFAGIGGLELGFESTGRFETKWQVEIDDYANQVLGKHWPSVARWKNVKTFPPRPVSDWQCDVIAGGFPCQDLSFAGKGAGLAGERSGLFSEIIRVAGIIKPRAIVLENVAALYVRGLGVVLGELAQIGYDAEWHCVSAASVGAPHRRDRVFIVAWHANGEHGDSIRGVQERSAAESSRSGANLRDANGDSKPAGSVHLANADGTQRERSGVSSGIHAGDPNINSASSGREQTQKMADSASVRQSGPRMYGKSVNTTKGSEGETNHVKPSGQGKESHWHSEPAVGRVANGVPRRVDRLRCLGNAIVPQVAQVVAERVLEILDEQDTKPAV